MKNIQYSITGLFICVLLFILTMIFAVCCHSVSSGTFTVNQWGTGDYTGLSNAEAGLQGVLVSSCYIVITGSWTADDGATSWAGWTTYSTASVIVQTQGLARHNGVWGNEYYRARQDISGALIDFGIRDIQIDGLQIENTYSDSFSFQGVITNRSGRVNFSVSNCIIKCNNAYGTGVGIQYYQAYLSGSPVRAWNNIIYGYGTGINWNGVDGTILVCYNNTIVGCNTGINGSMGSSYAVKFYCENNIVQNSSVADYAPASWAGYGIVLSTDTNISSDATSWNTNYQSKTVSFQNSATNYYLLNSTDTSAKGKGVNLSADSIQGFNTDIQGGIRPTIWSIGADDFPATVSTRRMRFKRPLCSE